jgi:hypothetical protein
MLEKLIQDDAPMEIIRDWVIDHAPHMLAFFDKRKDLTMEIFRKLLLTELLHHVGTKKTRKLINKQKSKTNRWIKHPSTRKGKPCPTRNISLIISQVLE